MQINKIIWWNLGLIVSIAVYGIITDEPYWKAVGHDPNLYDYFFWFATALNGPSSFAAHYLSWLTGRFIHREWWADVQFIIQYVLWCLLLWPQWKLYEFVANFSLQNRQRRVVLCLFVLLFTVAGGIASYEAWVFGHRDVGDFFIDKYSEFVRIGGVACSGLVFSVYAYLTMRHGRRPAPSPHPSLSTRAQ
jgi:hypothetical protein